MVFNMFANFTATLFLSTNMVTTLRFPSQIDKIMGGQHKTDIQRIITRDRTTVNLKPRTRKINTNLTVIMKNSSVYKFRVKYDEVKPHDFVDVVDGELDGSLNSEIRMTKTFSAWESNYTIRIRNNSNKIIRVNEYKVKPNVTMHFPKGPPLFINNKREIN